MELARDDVEVEVALQYTTAYNEAVSYTHLRAHETVLDLVCRLLLEKKNTQTHTHRKIQSYD